MARKKIKSEEDITDAKASNAILGSFEGECADANITNNNGLDIPREVWETVFDSDEYKTGIEKGWYIGYLGHPEDPGCQEFKDSCIVMTEGHIDDDGKVFGKFNLLDTPVGRIVDTLRKAGVTFGISVRGAGDIISNSVDPETFVFRGFDLVAFPAYPNAVPEFKEIAASTDLEKQNKYKKICASVSKELHNIESEEALSIIQDQFPEQSDIYNEIENRKCDLNNDECDITPEEQIELLTKQVDGLTQLYLKTKQALDNVTTDLETTNNSYMADHIEMSKKLHVIQRICAGQNRDIEELEEVYASELKSLSNKHKIMQSTNSKLKTSIDKEKQQNLSYLKKIKAKDSELKDKDKIIGSLQHKLDKTVIEADRAISDVSNLEAENKNLKQSIIASEKLIEEYQDAYASLYSQAIGSDLRNVSVTASTSVSQLQDAISESSHTILNSITASEEFYDVDDSEDGLIVM